MYSPETFRSGQPFQYRTIYSSSHFNSVESVLPQGSTHSSSGSTPTQTQSYTPNAIDVVGAAILGLVARPLILPVWLIQMSQSFQEPQYAV